MEKYISKIGKILILLVFVSVFIPYSKAFSWNDPGTNAYQNAYIVYVNNWNYSSKYGSNTFKGDLTNYVLLNLTITGDPTKIRIVGYTRSNQSIGYIPYWLISQTNNSAVLLIQNFSPSQLGFTSWNSIVVFFNPKTNVITGRADNSILANYQDISVRMINYSYLDIDSTLFRSLRINPPYSNKTYATINFSLSDPNGVVILANHSLVSDPGNISYFPDNLHGYQITNTLSTRYILKSFGTFLTSVVSGPPLESHNAQYLFNHTVPFDNIGYEGYFNPIANQIISEGLIVNESATSLSRVYGSIFNSTTVKGAGLDANYQSFDYGINLSTSQPTSVLILPAFTRSFTNSTKLTNPNATVNTTCANAPQGWYCDFLQRIPISVNWQYNFTSYATYGTPNVPITQTFNNVGYLKLTIKAPIQFGPYCQYVYFNSYNNVTGSGTSGGAIPFTVLSCNPYNSTASFILLNRTNQSNTYNSFSLYYDSRFNDTPDFSNVLVRNQWNFNNSATYNGFLNISASDIPYVVQLNQPLSFSSNIQVGYSGPNNFYSAFNGIQSIYDGCSNNPGHGSNLGGCDGDVPDYTNYPETTFLFANSLQSNSPGNPLEQVYTRNLDMYAYFIPGIDYTFLGNTINGFQFSHGSFAPTINHVYVGKLGNIANGYNLWSQNYTLYPSQTKPYNLINNCTSNCRNNNPFTTTIPKTPTRLNLTNTTTINFANLSAPVILFGSQTFPKYYFLIIALIVILSGGLLLGNQSHKQVPFILMIIGLWISGLWQIEMLILAFIITMFYIVHEYHA